MKATELLSDEMTVAPRESGYELRTAGAHGCWGWRLVLKGALAEETSNPQTSKKGTLHCSYRREGDPGRGAGQEPVKNSLDSLSDDFKNLGLSMSPTTASR